MLLVGNRRIGMCIGHIDNLATYNVNQLSKNMVTNFSEPY